MKRSKSAHTKTVRALHAQKKRSIAYISIVFIGVFLLIAGYFSLITSRTFCANSLTCANNLTTQIENNAIGMFEGYAVTPPHIDLAMESKTTSVLGDTTPSGEKRIFVDLSTQMLYAFQGDTQIFTTLVSTGKWGRTPTGDFHIWSKIRSTRMAGGSGNDAYNLPNVPFVMFYYNDEVTKGRGFSLHGAYWHNNFGHEMSHGCVNLRTIDAEVLFDWADPPTQGSSTQATADNPGTLVSVCSQLEMQSGMAPTCVE